MPSPALEILSRQPAGAAHPVPLLFVHGAFSAAWIWDEKMLPWFAAAGWSAHAVSLRGHGGSEGRERLSWHGLTDYVEDVLTAIDRLPAPPVLIGHSMGGILVQRALLRRRLPAAVLMASAPPHGLLEATVGLAWRDPGVFRQMSLLSGFGARFTDPDELRRAMFSDHMPAEEVARYEPLLQDESRRVLADLMHWNPWPPLPARGTPILVLGGEADVLIPPDQVRATARILNAEEELFAGMAHAMMLEPGWERVAAWTDAWLRHTLELPLPAG